MPSPTAATISIAATLSLLDGTCQSMAQAVTEGQYTFWLGSGISRDRVSNLPAVIRRILEYFTSRIDTANPTCPNRAALDKILCIARPPKSFLQTLMSGINAGVSVSAWSKEETDWIVDRLAENYSKVLDVQVDGEADEDHILWSVLDVAHTYGNPSLQPDCEHLCVAVLIAEGVVRNIATANWDGLVEAADDRLRGSRPSSLKVCVRQEDLRGAPAVTRLIKFHGCAVKALANEAIYRPLLIARRRQIADWLENPAVNAIRTELVNLVTTTPTLMIGLSAQDENIKNVFKKAEVSFAWGWPSCPPPVVFAEDQIGEEQELLLSQVYNSHYAANAAAIKRSAQIHAFGKPLLSALVLRVLCDKLKALVMAVDAPGLSPVDLDDLANDILRLRNRVADVAETLIGGDGRPDRFEFIRSLVSHMALGLGLYRSGYPKATGDQYLPLTDKPVQQTLSDLHLVDTGHPILAAALALLGRGESRGMGTLGLPGVTAPNAGALTIAGPVGPVRLFFAMNDDTLVRMQTDGRVNDNDDDAIVIQSSPVSERMTRSPLGSYGRTGARGLRVIGMAPLLHRVVDIDELFNDFRQEIGL